MIPGHDDGIREHQDWEERSAGPMHTIYYMAPAPMVTSTFATVSMIFGILGLVFGCCSFGIFSALAVVFGHLAMSEIKKKNLSGQGSAMAGLIMGYVLFFPMIMFSTYFVLTGMRVN